MFSALRLRSATRLLPRLHIMQVAKKTQVFNRVPVCAMGTQQPQLKYVLATCRTFSLMADDELKKRLDCFQELFVEARLCIEDCTDAADTTYFDEEAEAAREAVSAAVDEFESLIGDIEDGAQKNRVLRGNGLKVEQLKGELELALSGGH